MSSRPLLGTLHAKGVAQLCTTEETRGNICCLFSTYDLVTAYRRPVGSLRVALPPPAPYFDEAIW
jgi:hypothetical protein